MGRIYTAGAIYGKAASFADPRDVSTLAMWLRSDLGVATSGASITSWADQSGLGNTVLQGATTPTLVANQYNGQPCARFAASQYLQKTATNLFGSGAYTVFTVQKLNAGVNNCGIFSNDVGTPAGMSLFLNGLNYCVIHWNTFHASTTAASSVLELWTSRRGAAAAPTFAVNRRDIALGNSGVTGLTDPGAGAAITLGASLRTGAVADFTSCDICEVIAYTSVLSASDQANIESYLASRYAIQL